MYRTFLSMLAVCLLEYPVTPVLASGNIRADPVHVAGFRFDPLLENEPEIPAELRSPAIGDRLVLVQVEGLARREQVLELEAMGAEIIQYHPQGTWLAWLPDAAAAALDALGWVRWWGEYHPAYRLSPRLPTKGEGVIRILAQVVDRGSPSAAARIEALGGTVLRRYRARQKPPLVNLVAELDGARLTELARLPELVWLGPAETAIRRADEMSASIVAGRHVDGVPLTGYLSWLDALGLDGSGVIWSVVDSGVDAGHPDISLAGGINHGCETPTPGDDAVEAIGHGTPVAGIVAGRAATGMADDGGFLYGLGVAPGVEVYSQRDCFDSSGGLPPAGGWEEFTRTTCEAGAVGSNNSWGGQSREGYNEIAQSYDALVRDANLATPEVAEEQLIVFCAGNAGPDPASLWSTAQAKNVISVGATRNHREGFGDPGVGDIDDVASYSSRGPTDDGRMAPTIVAPGDAVVSARHSRGGIFGLFEIPGTDGYYTMFQGTSAAAPHVSGALAVITQWWRESRGGDDPSPAMARALLVNGAVDLPDGTPVPNPVEGWGRIDLGRVVRPAVTTQYLDQTRLLTTTGDEWSTIVGIADPSQPLRITLAWSDAPGALGVEPVLVNDLDLEVVSDGQSYLGNAFANGWSTTGGDPDRLNNLENVYLETPAPWVRLRVSAHRLVGDGVPLNGEPTDQDFAVVCFNCEGLERAARGELLGVQVNLDSGGADAAGDAANEPTIAVDPTAPDRMVMAWRQFDSVASSRRSVGHAVSNDGGRSWNRGEPIDEDAFRTDPVLAADLGGRFYYLGLGENLDHCELFTSDDGGWSWSEPLPAFGGDKPWMIADPGRSASETVIYSVWSTGYSCCGERSFTRSFDRGLSFSEPIQIDPLPEVGTMAVGPNRVLYVAGILDDGSFAVARSNDAWDPNREPSFTVATVDLGGWFRIFPDPNPEGLPGQVWVDVDRSDDAHHGAVYLLSSVSAFGSDAEMEVRLSRSDDGGASWNPAIPVAPAGPGIWQWFGTLAVAPSGRLDAVWIESLDPDEPSIGEIRYASSPAGGTSWSTPRAVSPVFDSHLGWPQQRRMGDYFHLRSDDLGADLAYAATFGGEQNVYFLRIGERDCNRNGTADSVDLDRDVAPDCNHNRIPDSCEIAAGAAVDGNGDGVPDSCTSAPRRGGRRVP